MLSKISWLGIESDDGNDDDAAQQARVMMVRGGCSWGVSDMTEAVTVVEVVAGVASCDMRRYMNWVCPLSEATVTVDADGRSRNGLIPIVPQWQGCCLAQQ